MSSVTFPSLISIICLWSFAFRCWRRTTLLALFQIREVRVSSYIVCGLFSSLRIRARTVNLAQASRACLSEFDEGSPRPSARVVAQAGGSDFERGSILLRRGELV
ncbi:hypothetical protein DEO72_LG9g1388 [Vigna unguiculata]|uniref:Uncharacterized protein n=1 Tax=Vigna unguiculata TaxID=3917 RepID=A0A4D6MY44_VIGUN|nr:hypothetical protein DEO72_LG9g1388 [Vigna unguiculata]